MTVKQMNIRMLAAEVQAFFTFTCQRVNDGTIPAAYNPKFDHIAFYSAFLPNIPDVVSREVVVVTVASSLFRV